MRKVFLLLFLFTLAGKAQQIQLSPQAELSVITVGPGYNELYATFGHSAFRIRDVPNNIDRVYNYGTFNFETPNFYLKFVRGKLLYDLSAYNFGVFLRSYHREKRWVKGQVLDLDKNEIQQVYNFLENNAKPENRSYKYDFFYDNCSTRLYDVLENVLGDKIIFDNNFDQNNYTHRDLIQLYLKNLPWGDFGIDLALGSVIDKKASAKEYMFLPDFVFKAFTKIKIKENNQEKPIVKKTEDILMEFENNFPNKPFTPMVVFSFLAILVVIFTFIDYKKGKRNKVLDSAIFGITGIVGIVVLLLWFATDHSTTVQNFNVLWAFAPNLIFAFLINRNRRVSNYYIITLLVLLDIMVLLWIFRIQVFHIAMIPILIALYIRYIYLWVYFKKRV